MEYALIFSITTLFVAYFVLITTHKYTRLRALVKILKPFKTNKAEIAIGLFTGGVYSLLDNGFKIVNVILTLAAFYVIITNKKGK
jgi:hypothetical protein